MTLEEVVNVMKRYEYKVIDTGKHIGEDLNELGAVGWKVAGVTTKKQLLIAPPAAIILMREVESARMYNSKPARTAELLGALQG